MTAAAAPTLSFQLLDVTKTVIGRDPNLVLFGRTSVQDGDESVAIYVQRQWPYVYVPAKVPSPQDVINDALVKWRVPRDAQGNVEYEHGVVESCDLVTKTDVDGFNMPAQYWRVALRGYHLVKQLREAINGGLLGDDHMRMSYISDYASEFFGQIDLGITNSQWYEVDRQRLMAVSNSLRRSTCKQEYTLDYTPHNPRLLFRPIEEQHSRHRVLSFDIEVAGRRGHFSDPAIDPIIQIATVVRNSYTEEVLFYGIYTWRTATLPLDARASFGGMMPVYERRDNERAMIASWLMLMDRFDIDVVTNYNGDGYDIPYIIRRLPHALPLGTAINPRGFGRLRVGQPITVDAGMSESKQSGKRERWNIRNVHGRLYVDMAIVILKSMKLRSYKLKHVAPIILCYQNVYEVDLSTMAADKLQRAHSLCVLGTMKPLHMLTCESLFSLHTPSLEDRVRYQVNKQAIAHRSYRITFEKNCKAPQLVFCFYDEAGKMLHMCTAPRASDEQKVDLHYTLITDYWNGTDDQRAELAVYCLRDAVLPLLMLERMLILPNYIEKARVCGISITDLVRRGQSIQTLMLVQRFCHENNYIVPHFPPRIKAKMGAGEFPPLSLWNKHEEDNLYSNRFGDEETAPDDKIVEIPEEEEDDDDESASVIAKGKNGTKYQGAVVFNMMRGFYNDPIATLDFASLYPNEIRTNNLCFATLIKDKVAFIRAGYTIEEHAVISPMQGDVAFCKATTRQGILPMILDGILAARSRAKKMIEGTKDPKMRTALDMRQLNLKLGANSIYGFTGFEQGAMPCMHVGASVTAYGRRDIVEVTQKEVEAKYGAIVLYGDTDSVFVDFHVKTVAEAMAMGKAACAFINAIFKKMNPNSTMSLEFEKILWPLVLINPKRYVGRYWTKPDEADKVFERGVESIRRDSCELVSELMSIVYFLILWMNDVDMAKEIICLTIQQLWLCEIPLERLAITKEWSPPYKNKQAHAVVAERHNKRDPGNPYRIGDRVTYVVLPHDKKTVVCDAVESIEYCKANNAYVDQSWIIENQLRKPIERIMHHVIGVEETHKLFIGEHTRTRRSMLPTSGGILDFFKPSKTPAPPPSLPERSKRPPAAAAAATETAVKKAKKPVAAAAASITSFFGPK